MWTTFGDVQTHLFEFLAVYKLVFLFESNLKGKIGKFEEKILHMLL